MGFRSCKSRKQMQPVRGWQWNAPQDPTATTKPSHLGNGISEDYPPVCPPEPRHPLPKS